MRTIYFLVALRWSYTFDYVKQNLDGVSLEFPEQISSSEYVFQHPIC